MVKRVAAALAVCLALPAAAQARDPGRWLLTGVSSVPTNYWQGLSDDPAGNVYFAGVFEGLWRTGPRLDQTAGVPNAIPAAVKTTEGYNHIGDPSWDAAEGGRLLLPLECYEPGRGNTCGTGSFGVADPATLAWRYHVKLDPAEIPKAMWAEVSPDGSAIWTSSGNDLLAYRAADVAPANAAPGAPPIRAVRRLAGAVPPSGITGAVFRRGRLLLAGYSQGPFRLYSVDVATGRRRLEIEPLVNGESEGLAVMSTLGGELHWLVAPFSIGSPPTFGPTSALMHFVPAHGRAGLRVRVVRTRSSAAARRVRVTVRVTRRGRAVRGARLAFAGSRVLSDRRGRGTLTADFERGGRFKVLAAKSGRRGLSRFVRVRAPAGAASAALAAGLREGR